MLKKMSKILSRAVAVATVVVLCPQTSNATGCGCTGNVTDYRYVQYQDNRPEVLYPVVKNYDCSASVPVQEYIPDPLPEVVAQPAPRPLPAVEPRRVAYIPRFDKVVENHPAKLDNQEVAKRNQVSKVREYKPVKVKKARPEFVMSSRSARQEAFEGSEKPCRDGSIFGGGPCKSKDKNGSIFGGGDCKNCTKNGSIFGGGSCKNCTKNGSILGGGSCKNCTKNGSILGGGACKNCPKQNPTPCRGGCLQPVVQQVVQPSPCQVARPCQGGCPQKATPCTAGCPQAVAQPDPQPVVQPTPCQMAVQQPTPRPTCTKKYELQEVVRQCSDFAPFSMEWVDFRIVRGDAKVFSRKLGNYRFRIFGCRRNSKNAILNEGRIVEKDMNFNEIFKDVVSDCYKVVDSEQCIDENTVLPEYILTAEIADYFMNVCDEYNWGEAKMENSRTGSSEMKVIWRLLDASKTNVLWKGETKGYAEVEESEYNGEMILIQRAFADAADNLRNLRDFEDQLAVRMSPEEMAYQRQLLIEMQKASGICQFKVVEDSGVVSGGHGTKTGWIEIRQTPIPVAPVKTPEVEVDIVTPQPIVEIRKPRPIITDPVVIEAAGAKGSAIIETSGMTDSAIIETSGMVDSGIVEDSGMTDSAIIEDSGVKETSMVVAPEPKPIAAAAIYEADKLCIVERADVENMNADNIGQTRNSVVAVTNAQGKKGAGLLVSEQFVMTSAELVDRADNRYEIETTAGKKLQAKAFRVNPRRSTALLVLSEPADYAPLALNFDLPTVEKDNYLSLGLLNFAEGEAYLDNMSKASSYRYTEDGTAEVVFDNFAHGTDTGAVLMDEKGRVSGIAHLNRSQIGGLFLPLETAMRSLGVEICGKAFPQEQPKPKEKVWRKPVAAFIDNPVAQAPEAMPAKGRK